ncbi:MAG: hypothetical protein K8F59_16180 [Rhodobacteraceae bacterium]|nr:hypothetical protein [Paracoccaceae bacterium]
MISRMIRMIWREMAETGRALKSVFGAGGAFAYIDLVAGGCVDLFACAKVTSRDTLPFLLGPVASLPGPFFFRSGPCCAPVAPAMSGLSRNNETRSPGWAAA